MKINIISMTYESAQSVGDMVDGFPATKITLLMSNSNTKILVYSRIFENTALQNADFPFPQQYKGVNVLYKLKQPDTLGQPGVCDDRV